MPYTPTELELKGERVFTKADWESMMNNPNKQLIKDGVVVHTYSPTIYKYKVIQSYYDKDEVDTLLNTKVNISQGVANAGKTLGINSSGNVEVSGDIYNKFEVIYTCTYNDQTDTYTITNCNHNYSEISDAIDNGYDIVAKINIDYLGHIETTKLQFVDINPDYIYFSISANYAHMNIEHSSQNTYSLTIIQLVSTDDIVQSTGNNEDYIMSQEATTRELNTKQNTLTAGNNININNNNISSYMEVTFI